MSTNRTGIENGTPSAHAGIHVRAHDAHAPNTLAFIGSFRVNDHTSSLIDIYLETDSSASTTMVTVGSAVDGNFERGKPYTRSRFSRDPAVVAFLAGLVDDIAQYQVESSSDPDRSAVRETRHIQDRPLTSMTYREFDAVEDRFAIGGQDVVHGASMTGHTRSIDDATLTERHHL